MIFSYHVKTIRVYEKKGNELCCFFMLYVVVVVVVVRSRCNLKICCCFVFIVLKRYIPKPILHIHNISSETNRQINRQTLAGDKDEEEEGEGELL